MIFTTACGTAEGPELGQAAGPLTSGPPGTYQVSLIPARSTWSLYDRGAPSAGWQEGCGGAACLTPATGPGPYGYGEPYLATPVAPGHPITTYFRHEFEVDRPIRALFVRVMFDDGFVAYVNGHEARRAAMPPGSVTHETIAYGHEALERYEMFDLSAEIPNLRAGRNQLAFEVHQGSTTSSDLVFDAQLIAWVDGPVDVTAQGEIPRGSLWHVWDRSGSPGAWLAPGYDDAGWSAGPAPLGFGESYLATVVERAPITTYFRKQVVIEGGVTALSAEVMYDDGFIAYLNGTEIARRAMPAGAVTPGTIAYGHEAEQRYETIDLAHALPLLREGENVLAVEVHQGGTRSSDLVFDLALHVTRGWRSQSLPGVTRLSDVYFRDAQTGWVAGDGGVLFRTDDGGTTWARLATGLTDPLYGFSFGDAQHGWLAVAQGRGGDLLRTRDGGATWSLVHAPFRVTGEPAAVDASTVWVLGLENDDVDYQYNLYRSRDGGDTWELARALPGPGRLVFASASRGWLVTWPHLDGRTFVARTDDGGATWTDVWSGGTFATRYARAMDPVGTDTLWLAGSDSTGTVEGEWMMVTRDAGASWAEPPPSGNDVYLHDIELVDELHGWASGVGRSIIHTDDGGRSWQVQLPADCVGGTCAPDAVVALSAVDPLHAWGVTFQGQVVSTRTGGR